MKRLLCIAVLALVLPASASAMTAAQAIKRVFGNSPMARCIAWHESSNRPWAVSPRNFDGSRDFGLFQVNDRTWIGRVVHWPQGPKGLRHFWIQRRWIFDPLYNAKVAFIISRGGRNWHPWSALRFCA